MLLIILDTVRAASLSLYGYDRPTTPNLERWARKGVVFDWAIATAPWTLPSHASIFTGRYPRQLSATAFTPLDASCPTLAETLSRSGLLTGGFTGNWAFTTRISGLARGFARYEDYPMTWGRFLVSSWLSRTLSNRLLPLNRPPWRVARKDAASNTDDFLRWLTKHDGGRFFAFLNFIDAHDPYFTAPSRIRRQFPPLDPPLLSAKEHVTEAELASTRAAYEASIAFIDEEIGRLLTELDRREILDQTMVIITSDHGEHFGEHGQQFHGNSLYLPLLHVPLVVIYPPLYPSGARVAVPVSIRDIAASVMESQSGAGAVQMGGRPLSRFFAGVNGAAEGREPLLIETDQPRFFKPWQPVSKGAMKALLAYPYHYIVEGDGQVELYDVESDYEEREDLSRSPAGAALAARLSQTLDSLISRNQRLSRESCRSKPRLIADKPKADRSAR